MARDVQRGAVSAPHGLVLAQLSLGLGGLVIGTGEFAAMGLLPDMAQAAGVSVPQGGGFISAYALGVVVGSPLLAVLTARMERRRLLLVLGVMVLLGNAASAALSSYTGIWLARFLAGLPHGAYYGTASIVAAAMVPPSRRVEAIGHVMLGLAAANLIGVPLATWLGQSFGWHMAFAAVAGGGVLLIGLLRWFTPLLSAPSGAGPLRELAAFGSMQVWLTLGVASIGFGGMFAVYSYITPTLTQVSHVAAGHVPWFLALWGLGMVVGNVVGGWLADRALVPAILGILIWNVIVLAGFFWASHTAVAAAVGLFLIGIGFALVPALQARLMDVARHAQALAAAMNHSAFNLSNAIGAWAGGIGIAAGFGWQSTGLVAAGLALAGLLLMVVSTTIASSRRAAGDCVAHPRSGASL